MTFCCLKNLPIKRKLTVMVMVTSGLALLLACAAFVTYEQIAFRGVMVRDLSITAQMIGDNSAAALSFNDTSSAEQTLHSLNAQTHLIGAAIYDIEGRLFARYQRTNTAAAFVPPKRPGDGHRFAESQLELSLPVHLAGEIIGTVHLQSDLKELSQRRSRYGLISLTVMLGALAAAFLLSRLMQKSISEPITHLAEVAVRVVSEKNYSVRAIARGTDELGRLIGSFNGMLDEIQTRDGELQKSRDELEQRVTERTQSLREEVAERKRSEEALGESETRTRTIVDTALDAVVTMDSDGRIVGWNTQAETIFGWSREEAIGRTLSETIVPPQHREAHERGLKRFLAVGHGPVLNKRIEITALRRDGQEFDIELAITPMKTEGRLEFSAFLRDISERKRTEAERAELQKQLVDTSRQAGMAEVATGVLHNVGNVLNSVNVSSTLVADSVRKSRLSYLTKAVALLREHDADLAAFLTTDPKGKQLPGYFSTLATHLAGEQAAALKELEHLQKNIEHIKDIVAMQQTYAKTSGMSEIVQITDLVEDSLNMNATALNRHGINVVREFAALPPVALEKHKVLQILVNLISNAKHACDKSGRSDKQITLRVSGGDGIVKISVGDNGVGIPPENSVRIFSHGFTTKKEGHGFGLHSGANAAREMGGSLTVASEGADLGATFTLELPLQRPKKLAA